MTVEFILWVISAYIIIKFLMSVITPFLNRKQRPVDGGLVMSWHLLFSEKINFYKYLNQDGRDLFIARVQEFMMSKLWLGFNDFELKQEHRLLISACGVQLTFGLKEFTLSHIERIYIAPEIFYSRLIGKDVKGLTVPNAIYLSWEDCKKGMDVNDDALNLCLHEFAHALEIGIQLENADTNFNYDQYLEGWEDVRDKAFEELNRNDETDKDFLRDYARTNRHEFFAVSVEYFFERSAAFKNKDPELYLGLCRLLNLNPLNTMKNYDLEKN